MPSSCGVMQCLRCFYFPTVSVTIITNPEFLQLGIIQKLSENLMTCRMKEGAQWLIGRVLDS